VQRQQKTLFEATRLLYVGATRAISHLLLTASVSRDEKTGLPRAPSKNSLLSSIWPVFEQQMTVHQSSAAPQSVPRIRPASLLTRLARDAENVITNTAFVSAPRAASRSVARPDNHVERSIGTVVHFALEELSRRVDLPEHSNAQDERRWRMALQREGLWGDGLDAALKIVHGCIAQTLHCHHIGRWILSSEHTDAHSEWALTTVNAQGEIRDIVIDRSFIDKETRQRWVIDYKNSRPAPGESLDNFIARQVAAYMEQLRRYCDAVRLLGEEPLRCALYFTALGHLHTVTELES
jgi:ATP-dependent helicase/nuclease subunit A